MPVERHRRDAELAGEPPDRERVEALGVGEGQRAVAVGLALDAVGLYLFSRLGAGATFAGLMPGFVVFGAGS